MQARLDSRLVVEQVSGRWQVKNAALRVLAREAVALMGHFPAGVTATWVPRAQNARADALANRALDGRPLPWHGVGGAGRHGRGRGLGRGRRRDAPTARGGPRPRRAGPGPRRPRPRPGGGSGWTPSDVVSTRTLLVRHGPTELTASRRFSGRVDHPLSVCRATSRRGRWPHGWRATAASTSWSRPPWRAPSRPRRSARRPWAWRWRRNRTWSRRTSGPFEGLTFARGPPAVPRRAAGVARRTRRPPRRAASPSRPSANGSGPRGRGLLERHAGRTLVVVSHVTPCKTLLRDALEAPASVLFRLHLDAAGLSVVDWHGDGPATVRLVNDTAHLQR